MRRMLVVAVTLVAATAVAHAASPTPIDAFARTPHVKNVAIAPSGNKIAFVSGGGDRYAAVTVDLTDSAPARGILSDNEEFELQWCNWANDKRLLCGFRGMAKRSGVVYPVTRLVAIDDDGSNMRVMIQNSDAGIAQFQDRILDWTPDEPDSVLIELDDDRNGYPSVFELDVNNGRRALRVRERAPIRSFRTDSRGNVRIGSGYDTNGQIHYFARLENEREWQRLVKIKAFAREDELLPIAIAPGTNRAFALGNYEGRSALWEMDLNDQKEPQLVFSHALVDAQTPILASDGRLLGIWYELDRPFAHYTDDAMHGLMQAVNKATPGSFNSIVDYSRDEKKLVIRSISDVDAGTYHVLDLGTNKMERLATAYPELTKIEQGRMRSIAYKAKDGTEIPGYLSVPPGVRAEQLPLVVMPHGGPVARDSWEFDFLRAFLVDRGYAVLQMNFRGSSGYGADWFYAAHQDWGGLTYSDIADATRWAIDQGVADPQRVAIVGWSFGGYAALLGAVRDSGLFRCSVSIAGISDLQQLLANARHFSNYRIAREQIGQQSDKLRADSPLRHIDAIRIPILMVHGDKDAQVPVEHSTRMASALKRAGKPHRAVILEDATHQLGRKSDRMTLLAEIEKFLGEHLGAGVRPGG